MGAGSLPRNSDWAHIVITTDWLGRNKLYLNGDLYCSFGRNRTVSFFMKTPTLIDALTISKFAKEPSQPKDKPGQVEEGQ